MANGIVLQSLPPCSLGLRMLPIFLQPQARSPRKLSLTRKRRNAGRVLVGGPRGGKEKRAGLRPQRTDEVSSSGRQLCFTTVGWKGRKRTGRASMNDVVILARAAREKCIVRTHFLRMNELTQRALDSTNSLACSLGQQFSFPRGTLV